MALIPAFFELRQFELQPRDAFGQTVGFDLIETRFQAL